MDSSSPDLSDYLDLDFVIAPPAETEDRPPVAANFVNVHGDGDSFALDFFYVHPAKVDRLFAEHQGRATAAAAAAKNAKGSVRAIGSGTASAGAGAGARGALMGSDTVRHESEPVFRLTIPLSTATELVTELVERIGEGVPHLRDVLEAFGAKLHALSHTAESGFDHGDDDAGEESEGDEGDDHDDDADEH